MRSPVANDEDLTSPRSEGSKTLVPCASQGETAAGGRDFTIISDIEDDFPIGPAEIAAIETYFGDLLDMVLESQKNAAKTPCRHKSESL